MKKNLLYLIILLISVKCYAGNVDTVSIFSNAMQKNVKCVIITPFNYEKSKEQFPVVYLLHGHSGNYAQWLHVAPQLKNKVDELQIIIVCPDGGFNSWYFDSEIDSSIRYETFISKELVKFIDRRYNTIAKKNGRAITGFSMGGHGALYISIKHKDLYGAAGSISGGVDIRPFPNKWDIKKVLGDTICCDANWQKNTVINVVDSLKNGELKLIFDCGVDDFFLQVNRNLHQKLLALKIDHDYTERPGAHNPMYWKNSIDYQLLFFNKFFEQQLTISK